MVSKLSSRPCEDTSRAAFAGFVASGTLAKSERLRFATSIADAAKVRYWSVSMASQDPALLRRLLRAKDRMDAASEEDWPVGRLANVSGVSEAHFARSFKEAFGVPPHRYLLTRRIERAKALLRDTDAPIIEITLQTGWNSLGTFGRVFRQEPERAPRTRAGERP